VSTVEEIRTAIPKLSVAEKLQAMEALWQSLSSKPEAVESPAWHEKTFRFNEAIKRNRERFPEDFMFRLTDAEVAALTSQFAISKKGRGGQTAV